MHRNFRKYLDHAIGISEFVVALNLDVRGFSSFSRQVESPEVALFIRKVFVTLIDKYFTQAAFYKSTGDGLLILYTYTPQTLQQVIRNVISICEKAIRDFGSLCANDPMINFEVPRAIGIGLSRGTACRLVSLGKTLDYSGRVLNLASRLMELARPTGMVFDGEFGLALLTNEQIEKFSKDTVYIKGIAEKEPIEIFYTKELTVITPFSKQALDKTKWRTVEYKTTLAEIRKVQSLSLDLPVEPLDKSQIKLKITHPSTLKGKPHKGFLTFFEFPNFEYSAVANRYSVSIRFDALAKRLEASSVKRNWDIKIEVYYPER